MSDNRTRELEKPPAPTEEKQPPENILLSTKMWLIILTLEFIHQILNIVRAIMDKDSTRRLMRESMPESDQYSDSLIDLAVIVSAVFMGLISLTILVVLFFMVRSVVQGRKNLPFAYKLLNLFACYLVIRALSVFFIKPVGSSVPLAFTAVDGSIQLLVSVASVLALIFATKPDARDWVMEHTPKKDDKNAQPGEKKDSGTGQDRA